jgi:hypothetical protein
VDNGADFQLRSATLTTKSALASRVSAIGSSRSRQTPFEIRLENGSSPMRPRSIDTVRLGGYEATMFRIMATFRTSLCLSLAMLVLIGPAAGWGAHTLTREHIAAAAAHHHGGSTTPAPGEGTPSAPDEQDGGHDHLQSLSLAVAALFGGPLLPTPPIPASIHGAAQVKVLRRLASHPPPADCDCGRTSTNHREHKLA